MDTASIRFILFGVGVATLVNVSTNPKWRLYVLLIASIIFIILLAPNAMSLVPFAGFLLLGYLSVYFLQKGSASMMVPCVAVTIIAYAWLKRYSFLPTASFLRYPYLVLGLSYVFFRVLHLIIETGEQSEQRKIGPLSYLAYTINFTTFICGPIQRYDDFAQDQFTSVPPQLNARAIGRQVERIIRGFFKVNVLAMLLFSAQQDAIAALSQSSSVSVRFITAIKIAIIYPLFLYCNFSGYIDIVIALARLMRLRLPENFNRPFSSTSFIDFWSRWHITLSLWLKTYVYNPLLMALMRRSSSKGIAPYLGVFSFFVTFFLVGIWHGRTSEFVFFGLLQGGGVAANKLWQIWLKDTLGRKTHKVLAANAVYRAFSRGLTFTWFAFTLFWFWASWKQIGLIGSSLGASEWIMVWGCVWLSSTFILELWERTRALLLLPVVADGPLLQSRYAKTIYASALALIAFVMSIVLSHPAPDLVYKAF
jgi:D-alanyl-lipoteichoic acid acyltransferase DltB (MBOAT superfamily)